MPDVILYDLPSNGRPSCWSFNPWKTRLALNYKGINYETNWVEYPAVEPTFKSFGLPPNESGTPYTIPTIRLGEDKYIMDSDKIAPALEKAYPEPSLHLDSPILQEIKAILPKAMGQPRMALIPLVPVTCLSEKSVSYFNETREKFFGKPLSKMREENDVDKCFEDGTPGFQELAALLKKEKGPFFMGETPSYSDFVVVSIMAFAKRLGTYEKITEIDPAFDTLYKACEKWLERDD